MRISIETVIELAINGDLDAVGLLLNTKESMLPYFLTINGVLCSVC